MEQRLIERSHGLDRIPWRLTPEEHGTTRYKHNHFNVLRLFNPTGTPPELQFRRFQ